VAAARMANWLGTTSHPGFVGNLSVSDEAMLLAAQERGGPLNLQHIAQVRDDLYVVGAGSQVYRRAQGKWRTYNEGLEAISADVFLSQGRSAADAAIAAARSSAMLQSTDGFARRSFMPSAIVELSFTGAQVVGNA